MSYSVASENRQVKVVLYISKGGFLSSGFHGLSLVLFVPNKRLLMMSQSTHVESHFSNLIVTGYFKECSNIYKLCSI